MSQEGEGGKRGRGRPAFEPTDEQRSLVRDLATAGIRQDAICKVVKWPDGQCIDEKTLRKHFADELETGTIEANAAVAGKLYTLAMQGNIAAVIFWLKTRGQWSETPQKVAITDAEGKDKPAPTLADFYATVQAVKPGDADTPQP